MFSYGKSNGHVVKLIKMCYVIHIIAFFQLKKAMIV